MLDVCVIRARRDVFAQRLRHRVQREASVGRVQLVATERSTEQEEGQGRDDVKARDDNEQSPPITVVQLHIKFILFMITMQRLGVVLQTSSRAVREVLRVDY